MPARMITIAVLPGYPAARVAAVQVAPGLLLTRGDRYCDCGGCGYDEYDDAVCREEGTPRRVCPRGSWSWRLIAECGALVVALERSVGEFRAAAAELGELGELWTTTDPDELKAAVADPNLRAQALGVLPRLVFGEFGPAATSPGEPGVTSGLPRF